MRTGCEQDKTRLIFPLFQFRIYMKDFTDDKEATKPRVPSDKVEVIKYFFYSRHHDLVKRFMSVSQMTQDMFRSS